MMNYKSWIASSRFGIPGEQKYVTQNRILMTGWASRNWCLIFWIRRHIFDHNTGCFGWVSITPLSRCFEDNVKLWPHVHYFPWSEMHRLHFSRQETKVPKVLVWTPKLFVIGKIISTYLKNQNQVLMRALCQALSTCRIGLSIGVPSQKLWQI